MTLLHYYNRLMRYAATCQVLTGEISCRLSRFYRITVIAHAIKLLKQHAHLHRLNLCIKYYHLANSSTITKELIALTTAHTFLFN